MIGVFKWTRTHTNYLSIHLPSTCDEATEVMTKVAMMTRTRDFTSFINSSRSSAISSLHVEVRLLCTEFGACDGDSGGGDDST